MRNGLYFWIIALGVLLSNVSFAQNDGAVPNIQDDIQVDVSSVKTYANGDTLSVSLFLISYQRDPREFKLNAYATQVVDSVGNSHLFTLLKMGRVQVSLADRQNYMHYLLEENVPVPLTLKIGDWKGKKAAKIKLVFEDSTEEGKFIEQEVPLY